MSELLSILAVVISGLSLYLTYYLWVVSNRPVVSAVVSTVQSGNMGSAIQLIIRNNGNRSAKDIVLSTDEGVLHSLLVDREKSPQREAVIRVFDDNALVPILCSGESVSCAFGFLSVGNKTSTWRKEGILPISIRYKDLVNSKKYNQRINLKIADNDSITSVRWVAKSR